jgi:methylmalonyl-CoA/ethylmalonyl-CoA epimerase
MEFHHIGIATIDIEKSAIAYSLFGYRSGEIIYDPIQKVNLCFLEKERFPIIELVSPTEETSPVNNILSKNGTMPYHTCYEVDDMITEIANLKRKKFLVVVNPVPAVAFENRKVCFLYSKMTGLIELLEKNN